MVKRLGTAALNYTNFSNFVNSILSLHVFAYAKCLPFQIEKINSSGMAIQIKRRKEQQRKLYLELRKKFGLFKEERVYLRRIPLPVSLTRPAATVFSSSVQMCAPCELPQAVPTKVCPKEKDRVFDIFSYPMLYLNWLLTFICCVIR